MTVYNWPHLGFRSKVFTKESNRIKHSTFQLCSLLNYNLCSEQEIYWEVFSLQGCLQKYFWLEISYEIYSCYNEPICVYT